MDRRADLVRAAFEAVEGNDVEAFVATLHPHVEFLPLTRKLSGGEPYRGHEGVREWSRDRNATWQLGARIDGVEERGEALLVRATVRTAGGASGVELDTPTSWVVRFRDGKIARIEGFGSPADAEEALARARES